MSSLANQIEAYIKYLLKYSQNGYIELQRQYLANRFECVPSQINYVLATRFTDSHGYVVETRRGGGGFIKIAKINIPEGQLAYLIKRSEDQLSQQKAHAYISQLKEEGYISNREAKLMEVVMNRDNLRLDLPQRDQIRATLFKAMLRELLRLEK